MVGERVFLISHVDLHLTWILVAVSSLCLWPIALITESEQVVVNLNWILICQLIH